MADTVNSNDVIDLTTSSTSEEAATAANVTPDRPTKRVRLSRRLEALRDQEKKKKVKAKAKGNKHQEEEVEEEDAPQYEANDEDRKHTNGYFEVDEILDRRTRKYGSESAGLRHVVEYRKCARVLDAESSIVWLV